jgi:transcriptional antiterminator RfaH
MPMLPEEPSCYPANLFTNEPEPAGPPGALEPSPLWWVLHTKPRQEKALARHLYRAGVPFYLPLVRRRSLVRGRVLCSHVPLFTGYLFLLASHEERAIALATDRVVQALPVAAQERLWRDLSAVHRLIATGAPVTPEGRLGPSAAVEITSGPLAGMKGKILRGASGRRFVVQVDFIQQGASVLLDDFMLTPAG